MAQPGALDNAGIRSLYDEQESYYPADTNIAKGLVVVFDNTSGDNRSVVLPNHANVLLGGRSFAGISAVEGSPVTAQDKAWTVQCRGTADCLLKNSTACTRGQIAAYDPADGGRIVPLTSVKQQPIGRFQQTKSAGTDVMVGVRLGEIGGARAGGLIGAIVASSTAIGTDPETLMDQSVTIPANLLQANDVLHIVGKVRATVGANAETVVLKLYFGGLTGLALATCTATNVAQHDVWVFDIWVTIRSATTVDVMGWQTVVPAATNVAIPLAVGLQAPQTIPTITGANVVGVSANWSAASNDLVALESLIVEHLPQTA